MLNVSGFIGASIISASHACKSVILFFLIICFCDIMFVPNFVNIIQLVQTLNDFMSLHFFLTEGMYEYNKNC
jgi:hypothetical protein